MKQLTTSERLLKTLINQLTTVKISLCCYSYIPHALQGEMTAGYILQIPSHVQMQFCITGHDGAGQVSTYA